MDLPIPTGSAAKAAPEAVSEVSKIKRDRALIDLESGSFEPKSFTSSSKKKSAGDEDGPVVVDTFAFGKFKQIILTEFLLNEST